MEADAFPQLLGKFLIGDGCWEWQAATAGKGYGKIASRRLKAQYYAHRVMYAHFYGEIPEGLTIDHLCRNIRCVRPDHLEAVTQKVNVNRGLRGRKTHCLRGHEYTPENTKVRANGTWNCKTCAREVWR